MLRVFMQKWPPRGTLFGFDVFGLNHDGFGRRYGVIIEKNDFIGVNVRLVIAALIEPHARLFG